MGTNTLKKIEMIRPRNWKISVKTDDGGPIRYEEPFVGSWREAKRRAWIMWARTSFVVEKGPAGLNRDVYTSLEVWDEGSRSYRMIREKRGRLDRKAPAPAQS